MALHPTEVRHLDLCPYYHVPPMGSTVESSPSTWSSLASWTNESCVPRVGSRVESSLATDKICAPAQMGPPKESRVTACSANETRLSVPTTGLPDQNALLALHSLED